MEHTTEVNQVRNHCGYFLLEDWCIISAKGKETFSFLQTQSTNDVLQIQIGQGQNNAITDRQARLIANFSVHRTEEHAALILIETSQKDHLLNHLKTYHFREEVEFTTLNCKLLALQGPKSPLVLEKIFEDQTLPEKPNDTTQLTLDGKQLNLIVKSLTGEEGYILCFQNKSNLTPQILKVDTPPIKVSETVREVLRIEAGIPIFGKDMDSKNILPETGLEHSSVSYNKGCYIGQEVIARIKTYGAPNFALMGLTIEGSELPPYNSTLRLKDKKIGTIKSSVHSTTLNKVIALAYIHKEHRSPDVDLEVTVDNIPFKVKTCLLPFYQAQTRRDHSKRILNQALQIYKDQDNLDHPIALLREAIELDTKNADAYEALGVFLSKQDKLDEAIALMKRLTEINPQEIMAHTNLSVYYMKLGRIEDAEFEKAEATALQFERAIEKNMAQKLQKKEAEQKKKEMEERVGMFKKVLEIDPKDQVANFGLGSIYLETGRYQEGLEPLKTVIEEYQDYSAAYLLLGKTWEKLSNKEEAIETYKKGIAAASKKGDLMPLKDMQNRMNQLLHPL
ncbi:MAG: tetratricopeptide repeat protein [Nitrospina sp.]|jgi:folate-binding protein YgfZ|nr:tetratricopeptide repeat protein [Nitrospina sp.]MBT5652421.1 tetratricopeptide repeat protein [Nitrospina sp.]